MNIVRNLITFKIGWVACVMFAAAGQPLLSLLSVAAVVALHLSTVAAPAKETLLLLLASLLGLVWESALVAFGLVEYAGANGAWLAPAWIIAMWTLFATTINYGLSWVKRFWVYAALAGAIGGPMAFWGGSRMGAVVFPDLTAALLVIGIGWAFLLPLLALLAESITDSTLFEPGYQRRGLPVPRVAAQVQSLVNRGEAIR
jgi:hypothetical protein